MTRRISAAARLEQEPDASLGLIDPVLYEARGGVRVERALAGAPMGDPANLNGEPFKLRYSWRDPATLALT